MFNTKIKPVEQPFPEKLKEYIARPPSGSIKMLITPEMALDMLTYNDSNRPLSKFTVDHYAKQMKEGKWVFTGETIIFSDEGKLRQGQHRLHACFQAGASFPCDVVFGRPDAGFAYMDTGKKRGGGDVFAINGVPNAVKAAAITRVLVSFQRNRNLEGGYPITPAELFEEYKKMPGIQECVPWMQKFQRARLGMPSVMAAAYYLCSEKSRSDAEYFFKVALDGGGRTKYAPEQELHRILIVNATSSEKMRTGQCMGLVITAWNRARRGLSGRGLSFDGGKIPAVQ